MQYAPAAEARKAPDQYPANSSGAERTRAGSSATTEGPSPRSPRSPRSVAFPFMAYVVVDFASEASNELSVHRGEFVTVEADAGPLPEGWCKVSIDQPGRQKRTGLVPWEFLVSSAHADEAAANPVARPSRVMLEFTVTRGRTGALGLDLDEENQVRRIANGSSATGQLEVGDLVLAVDGVSLEGGMSILDVLDTTRTTYQFCVLRREMDSRDAYSAGIMDTAKLGELSSTQGSASGDDAKRATKYYSASGRQVAPGVQPRAKGVSRQPVEDEASTSERLSERKMVVNGLPNDFFSPAQQVQQGARMTRLERVVKVRRRQSNNHTPI